MFFLPALILLQGELGPTRQAGSSAEFYRLCYAVEQKLEQGDFAAADKAARMLPRAMVSFSWDDAKVPAMRRAEFQMARDQALAAWTRSNIGIEFKEERHADIKFSFVDELPPNADSNVPAGAVHFYSESPEEPRVEAVIALKRGLAKDETELLDVFQEVAYAVASYFGIHRNPVAGSFAFRSEEPVRFQAAGAAFEFMLARRNIEISETLRKAVVDKKRLTPTRPEIRIEPGEIALDPVVQGDKVTFSIQISNVGSAPLLLRVRPDCGCLAGKVPSSIPPGGSGIIEGSIDTTEFVGPLRKRFFVYSNDPDQALRQVPITVSVKPLFRLLSRDGNAITIPKGKIKTVQVFLSLAPDANMKVLDARVEGRPAAMAWDEWMGDAADPEMGESERTRRGYQFRLTFDDKGPPGRSSTMLVIETDNPKHPVLRYPISSQLGIVAVPEEVYFGEIQRMARRARLTLIQPGTPFRITKVESSSPRMTVTAGSESSDEHRLTVELDGNMDYGQFNAILTIFTDDPDMPQVVVPVRAVVR